MAGETKDGNELIDEIAETPNLDYFYDRNPTTLKDADLRQLVDIERRNRALFIEKKGK